MRRVDPRSYQNQRDHDDLSRGAAEELLRRLIDNEGPVSLGSRNETQDVDVPDSLPDDWVNLYKDARGSERAILLALVDAGCPRPEIGLESAGGIPISIAWPHLTTAIDLGLEQLERSELEAEGWTVLPLAELVAKMASDGNLV